MAIHIGFAPAFEREDDVGVPALDLLEVAYLVLAAGKRGANVFDDARVHVQREVSIEALDLAYGVELQNVARVVAFDGGGKLVDVLGEEGVEQHVGHFGVIVFCFQQVHVGA